MSDAANTLNVLVLAGGPDREREVSLRSGAEVSAALKTAGHRVEQRDICETDVSALDHFKTWPGDVIFPVLHGPWGEGGGLQQLLEARGLPFVGTRSAAAELCMDKPATKTALASAKLPTPAHQVVRAHEPIALDPPVVIKPTHEGSSIGMAICHDRDAITAAQAKLSAVYPTLLVERYVAGREITVGVLGEANGAATALPPIEIVPAATFYDYHAKYDSDQTQYRFDIDLPDALMARLRALAVQAHRMLGARHLSRVDFIVDEAGELWILEINTLPGFTTHSLLPMAAARAGLAMPALVDRLARLGVAEADGKCIK